MAVRTTMKIFARIQSSRGQHDVIVNASLGIPCENAL